MFLGVDIGGTTIKSGLVTDELSIIKKSVTDTYAKESKEFIVNHILEFIEESLNNSKEDVKYIGIGCPGNIDSKSGLIRCVDNINITGVNIKEVVENKFNIKTYVSNDANCAALGEALIGASKGYSSSVMLTIGTGIGGGIIVDNKIYLGCKDRAGEFGQITIKFDDIKNKFGRVGTYEDYASMTALIRQAKEVIEKNPDSLLAKNVKENNNDINGKIVFDSEAMGCPVAHEVVEKYIFYLSVGIKNIIMCIRPDVIVIGGGISKQKEKLIERIYKYIDGEYLDSYITTAKLGNDAGIIGAASLGL